MKQLIPLIPLSRWSLFRWEHMCTVDHQNWVNHSVIKRYGCVASDIIKPKSKLKIKFSIIEIAVALGLSRQSPQWTLNNLSYLPVSTLDSLLSLWYILHRPALTFSLPSSFFPPFLAFHSCFVFSVSLHRQFSPVHVSSPPHDSSHESLEKPDLLGKVLGKQW